MFPSGSIEVVFERFAKAGIGGFDLFLPHIPYLEESSKKPEYFRQNLENCRLAAEAAGVPITGILGVPTPRGQRFKSYLSGGAHRGRADALDFVRHNVEVATALGASNVCTGEGALPPDTDADEVWDRLFRTLKEAAPICESRGITLNLEPHPGYVMASNPERARKLIEEVGSESIRICLDFCHANVITGGYPVSMIEMLAGSVGMVHISDGIQTPSLHLPIGQGEIDVDACIKAVKRTGFDGRWVLCMYGCSFPEFFIQNAIRFLEENHSDILVK